MKGNYSQSTESRREIGRRTYKPRHKREIGDVAPCDHCGGTVLVKLHEPRQCFDCKVGEMSSPPHPNVD